MDEKMINKVGVYSASGPLKFEEAVEMLSLRGPIVMAEYGL